MKLAIVCDWLTGMRGGERCLEVLCDIYPAADIFTLVHVPGSVSRKIESHRIFTSFLQCLPGSPQHFRCYLPIFPMAVERFRLDRYDFVLSLSHCVAKGAMAPDDTPHLCYCYGPMRYAWRSKRIYLSSLPAPMRLPAGLVLERLKRWDAASAQRVTQFVAVSKHVSRRIEEAYGRASSVIYPPVDCGRFRISSADDGTYLVVSALVPHKRIDLALEAFRGFDRRLTVIGDGPLLRRLRAMAPPNVEFLGRLSDAEVTRHMERCSALIFPGEEDFGIVPVEANSAGKPVIAYARGGALETVVGIGEANTNRSAPTGIFFHDQTPAALRNVIVRFEKLRGHFNPDACRRNALRFDRKTFVERIRAAIETVAS